MVRLPARATRSTGFTLLELVIVMILLGVIAGLGVASYDNFAPGNRAVSSSVQTFLESSRDQARISGHPVVVEVQYEAEYDTDRLVRRVQRPRMEAGFEPAHQRREGVMPDGAAVLGASGRYGAALDLRAGGNATVGDGESLPDTRNGYVLEFHFLDEGSGGARLFEWDNLVEIRTGRGGDLVASVRAGEGEYFSDVRVDVPPGLLEPGRWHLLQLRVEDAQAEVRIDGTVAVVQAIPPVFGSPEGPPRFGDPDDAFHGLVDEFTFRARAVENGPELRSGIRIRLGSERLVFDRHGRLDATVHGSGVPVEMQEFDETFDSFVVGRFTEEVMP